MDLVLLIQIAWQKYKTLALKLITLEVFGNKHSLYSLLTWYCQNKYEKSLFKSELQSIAVSILSKNMLSGGRKGLTQVF